MELLNQADAPYFDALCGYLKEQNTTFHVPGHQHGLSLPTEFAQLLHQWGAAADITEVLGIDDIHLPLDQLKRAQELAASAHGAEQTFFLVNGSTAGNQAMFLATLSPQDTVLIPQGSHRSAYAGLLLSGARASSFVTAEHPEVRCSMPPSLLEVERAVAQTPQAKALFLTSPNYHGAVAEVRAITDFVHARGMLCLVDEAWGSHLAFSSELPESAVTTGADLVVQSTHKLSGALTQSAMLHRCGTRVDAERLQSVLRHLQTSSPSSLLVASIDCARRQMALQGEALWSRAIALAREGRMRIEAIPGVHCFLGDERWDPTRLIINACDLGYSGHELNRYLRTEHRIQVEMSELHQVLILVTPGHTTEHIDRLVSALTCLTPKKQKFSIRPTPLLEDSDPPKYTVREVFSRPTKRVDLDLAVDQTSAELLYCYPPGVSVLYPGQQISQDIVTHVKLHQENGSSVQGGSDPTLRTVLIVDEQRDE